MLLNNIFLFFLFDGIMGSKNNPYQRPGNFFPIRVG
ncbi:hypothetical protein NIASO_02470 [Niabella soli DSM 19437]|uniref:Uncharacterized protein n=1 Tax=Niabella soli DSM 19437 TaxID=929713 RepID=W0F6R6_9BACT|nr:hypothetical protein NIASO_02470 [Niabella soli DSM 19437]